MYEKTVKMLDVPILIPAKQNKIARERNIK